MKEKTIGRKRMLHVLMTVSLLLMISGFFVTTYAAEPIAHSESDESKVYTSVSEAWNGACNGETIVMDKDWVVDAQLTLNEGKTVTIKMNNHEITHASDYDGCIFSLRESSTLNLEGSDKADHTFDVDYYNRDDQKHEAKTIKTGGLLSGAKGKGDNKGYGIYFSGDNINLNLTNMAIVGHCHNGSSYGGGAICIVGESNNVTMKNAQIAYNVAYKAATQSGQQGDGGGIFVQNSATITLKRGSSIRNNVANKGGGMSFFGDGVTVNLEDSSKIEGNSAASGGAIYFDKAPFVLQSKDKTGIVSNNTSASDGGAVYIDSNWFYDQDGDKKISGVTFTGNKATNSDSDGGALYLDKEDIQVVGCTFTKNEAGRYGGAILNENDNNTIDSCTIRNNVAGTEGGGVWTASENDISIKGKLIIENNNRKDGADDDLFLEDGIFTTAYALGQVEQGSRIGIRTGCTGNRKLVRNLYTYIEGSFFLDQAYGYHLGYKNSNNELWQYPGAVSYNLTLNGLDVNKYQAGNVAVVDGTSQNRSMVFRKWTAAEGYPGSLDAIEDAFNPVLRFKMPGNDVNLKAEYIYRADAATLHVEQPIVGEKLRAIGKLYWKNNGTQSATVTVKWEEVADDGTRTAVSGVAKKGVKYTASVSVEEDASDMRAFDLDLTKANVEMYYIDANAEMGKNQVESASVDKDTGLLSISGAPVEVNARELASVDDVTMEVQEGTTAEALMDLIPDIAIGKTKGNEKACVDVNKKNFVLPDTLVQDGKVVKTDDSIELNIPVTSDSIIISDGTAMTVKIKVTDAPESDVAVPVIDENTRPGEYESDSLKEGYLTVKVSCATDGSTIYYKVDDEKTQTYTEDGIRLDAWQGWQKVHTIQVWAEKDGSTSNICYAAYYLNDQRGYEKSVTVECSGSSVQEVVAFVAGDTVKVLAPTIDGKVFDSWTVPEDMDEDAYSIKSNTITFKEAQDDITVTANYKDTVTAMDLKMDAPTAGKSLAKAIDGIAINTSGGKTDVDASSYFDVKNISWIPEGNDGKADYNTSYVFRLPVIDVENQSEEYVPSKSMEVTVNGESIGAIATPTEENDQYVLYITFPKTAGKPSMSLSSTSYSYNGKVKTPAVTVKVDGKILSKDKYSVTYASGRKKVGKYKVTVTLKNGYSDEYRTLSSTFIIQPKKVALKNVRKGKKSFTVTWKKQTAQTGGYQIQYSTNKNFKSAKMKTVTNNKKTALKVKNLKAKKKYYVRIRSYKKVSGTTYHSGWSGKKTVKTK